MNFTFNPNRTEWGHLTSMAVRTRSFGRAAVAHLGGEPIDPDDIDIIGEERLAEHIDLFGHDSEAWRISYWLMIAATQMSVHEYAQYHETPVDDVSELLCMTIQGWHHCPLSE